MHVIDYDEMDTWESLVESAVLEIAPVEILHDLQLQKPEFVEDARDFVLERIDRGRLVQRLNDRLSSCHVRLYHGTRLSAPEIERVGVEGLLPLNLTDRRHVLEPIFKQHKRWNECKANFDKVLDDIRQGKCTGKRENGLVWAFFSHTNLVLRDNHYLKHGAEVDGHIACKLFGDCSADPLLQRNRCAKVITFLVPFADAVRAADRDSHTEMPRLLRTLLGVWAYRQAKPTFTVASLRDDIDAGFPGPIPIEDINDVSDAELGICDHARESRPSSSIGHHADC